MTGTINKRASIPDVKRSSDNFAQLMTYVANLYCANASSSVSSYEAHELTLSVSYTLDIVNATFEEAALVLDVDDPIGRDRARICQGDLHAHGGRRDDALRNHRAACKTWLRDICTLTAAQRGIVL